ncbi:MAG TPA: aminotransferase class I/II-fold pyridoxal phosphate-dependent enzyme [Gemmatimonadaceae bacterium]
MTAKLGARSNDSLVIPDFGDQVRLEASLSRLVSSLPPSGILRISDDVRARVASGGEVVNLTVGDFDPRYFPIPAKLLRGIQDALAAGATNYPAPPGVMALREAVRDYVQRESGVRYPIESILIASGGRPILYGAYRTVVSPGDKVVYSVPSWQNEAYICLSEATPVVIEARSENGFQPTIDELAPHLRDARLICLCSPGNPTGTAMDPEMLRSILAAVVGENQRRLHRENERPLVLLYDQIYGSLRVSNDKHRYAAALLPECAPYVMSMDGASKAFAGTGIRVAWLLAAPAIAAKMGELLSHVGTWAPHAEQVGLAHFLSDVDAVREYRSEMDDKIHQRLDAVYNGFVAMRDAGLPVDCIYPEGAIYVSLQLQLIGKHMDGRVIKDNDTIRSLLLEKAGVAVVPFQAFGLEKETGWFRLSIGAVSMQQIAEMFPRIRALLQLVSQ